MGDGRRRLVEVGGPCPDAWRQLCLSPPGILGMVELGAQSIIYELATVVVMVSVPDGPCGGAGCVS